MSDKMTNRAAKGSKATKEEPKIRFGEHWIPAHQAWKKMETASAVADVIDHFNTHFPELSTPVTRDVVPTVRQRLKDIQLQMPTQAEPTDHAAIAMKMLRDMAPEDVIDELARDHDLDINLQELIALAGQEAYLDALQREAKEYEANMILAEQTSQIWNEMARPAPGGGLWNKVKVEKLINEESFD